MIKARWPTAGWRDSFAERRLQILLGQRKIDEAYRFTKTFGEAHATNDFWQNELAWTIVTVDSPGDRNLGLAESMAERAVQLTKGQNAGNLDTLARAQFMLGKKEEACTTEQEAVNITADPREKDLFGKTLASYQAGTLPKPQ